MKIKNQTSETADLYFYGDIVSDWWGAWQDEDQYPEAIRKFLSGAEGKNLNIHINSGGGSVFAGIAIYNMLKHHNGHKTVYVDGMAASIASVIAMAGDEIIMHAGSCLMIHNPLFGVMGYYNAAQFEKMAQDLTEIRECIIDVYKSKLHPTVEIDEIKTMMDAETWIPAETAGNFFDVKRDGDLQAVAWSSKFLNKISNETKKAQAKLNYLKGVKK